ncbi:MAG: creatininase family protein [Paenibacillaceae bacterium]
MKMNELDTGLDWECRWERLLPEEFRAAFARMPVVYLPLGTVEWHGEHLALGLDSLKSHGLCVKAAKRAGGGIVHPPLYGGMGGLDKPATVIMEGEYSWDNYLLKPWLEKLCSEFHRLGFKAIVIFTGHYGHNQQIVVRETAVRMSARLRIPVIGLPEYLLAQDVGYLGDHAGIGETSLLAHLEPELVRMERLANDPEYGATDEIAKGASAELGRLYTEMIVERLSSLVVKTLNWDDEKLEAYIRAEQAMLQVQLQGWRQQEPWAAWNKMFSGEIVEYGSLLADEKFTEIEALARKLL